MRIVHIDTGRQMRGGQHQLLLLLRGLEAQKHQQVLLAGRPLLEHWKGMPAGAFNLLRLSRQADIIHAHDAHSHTLAALFCSGKPVVVSRRVAFDVRSGSLSRWKYARATVFIAVSDHVKETLLRAGIPEEKVRLVYDGVDLPAARPKVAAGPLEGRAPRVVAPQVHDPLKGAELLTAACRSIGAAVTLSHDLAADLPSADVFVYLSETEGLGSAILLAMAHAVPVVASRVGGIPEIVEDEVTGLLVENQVEAVASAILRFANDCGFANACRERAYVQVCERFSDAIMVRQTERVYCSLLGLESPSW